MAGIEKRKERRIKIALPVKIIYPEGESCGFTGNISRLGAYAEIDKELPIGSEVGVVLEIPDPSGGSSFGGKIKCRGNIFRSSFIRQARGKKYYGLGIFFTDFAGGEDRERLSRYVEYLIGRQESEIRKGAEQWREKRKMREDLPAANSDMIALLKQILNKLKEIRSLLKPAVKNK